MDLKKEFFKAPPHLLPQGGGSITLDFMLHQSSAAVNRNSTPVEGQSWTPIRRMPA
jgi:hypothetical protein